MTLKETLRPRARRLLGILAITGTAVAISGCGDRQQVASPDELRAPEDVSLSMVDGSVNSGLADFRRATAPYHRVEAALEDGFVPILECQESPDGQGALGIPFARLDRFDDEVDLSEPEILFYEPQPNGRLRLVGGEPVVPIETWSDTEPPTMFGREFHRNEAHGLFGLHMWIWKHNPNGVFAFWHPDVTCDFAD